MPTQFGTITKLPSGRYRARYRHLGERLAAPFTFQTKMDAGAWLAHMQTELAKLAHRPEAVVKAEAAALVAKSRLFGPYAVARVAARTLKPRAREEYENLLNRYLLPTFGTVPMVDIDPPMVRQWFDTVMGDRRGKSSGNTARAHAYGLLKSILSNAVSDGYLVANPCTVVGALNVRAAHKPVPVTVTQLNALAAATPERYRAMVLMSCWCGLRFGEVAALRRCDLTTDGSELSIRRGAIRLRGQGTLTGTPKSEAGIRLVSVPGPLTGVLVDHLARFVGPSWDDLLFPAENGRTLPSATFYRWFHRARAAADLPDLHFHDLRHTGATWAADGGASLKEIMQRIGHSTPGAAMRYQHAGRKGDRAIADRLAAKFVQ